MEISSTPGEQDCLIERYLHSRARIPIISEQGILHAEALLLYCHVWQQEYRLDSRILFSFLIRHTTLKRPSKTHEEWITLAKMAHAAEGAITFREMDLRQTPQGDMFLMLDWLQAAVCVMSALRSQSFTAEQLVEHIFDFAALHWSQRFDLDMVIPLLPLMVHFNETVEEIQLQRDRKTQVQQKKAVMRKTKQAQRRHTEKKEGK